MTISGSSASPLPDFTALSKQIAKATPSLVNMQSYTPTNTQARDCPPTGVSWNASSVLPPTPNQVLCSCVVANLSCIANPGLSSDVIADLFSSVCGLDNSACNGIASDGSQGQYGSISACNATEQLSWAFNAYFSNQNGAADACSFGGNATVQQPSTPHGACNSLLEQVGAAGTGTVTSQPTYTGGTTGGGTVAPSGGSTPTSSSTKKASGAGALTPSVNVGVAPLVFYVVLAMLTGAGMILL